MRHAVMSARRRAALIVLAVLTVVALAGLAQTGWTAWARRGPGSTGIAPSGLVSLQLASTREAVTRILHDWRRPLTGQHPLTEARDTTALGVRREYLAVDATFIRQLAASLACLGLTLIFTTVVRGRTLALAALGWLALVAATVPCAEIGLEATNAVMGARIDDILDGTYDGLISRMRLGAQFTLVLLLGQGLILLAIGVVAVRRWLDPESLPDGDPPPVASSAREAFSIVTATENEALRLGGLDRPAIDAGPAGEPWVRFRSADLVGLALSGGGIRSATFGLGILQGLDYHNVLRHVHYLSTVSGGGYVGGFWSAWRQRRETGGRQAVREIRGEPPLEFPRREVSEDGALLAEPDDPEEVRHLREFSRFLAPRIGFFEVEMWHAIVAFVGGLVPSLAATGALLFLAMIAWLSLNFPLACPEPWAAVLVLVLLTAGMSIWLEQEWWLYAAPESRTSSRRINLWALVGALIVVGTLQAWLPTGIHALTGRWWPLLGPSGWIEASGNTWPAVGSAHVAWWQGLMGGPGDTTTFYLSLRLFDFPVVWLAAAALGLGVRLAALMLVAGRGRKGIFLTAFDRMLMRLVGLALLWLGAATLWHIGRNLDQTHAWTAAAGALATGGSFGMLRRWMSTLFSRRRHRRSPPAPNRSFRRSSPI
jgi:hypothetical protein